ncbi:hypothetical protein AXX17_AT2G00090 [Arabidopsis thaliana]|uniref:Uncharacterized protein n=1 Tax=Arabidopsis thaliana TaxID=3702 RepID=A0A178VYW8_ARATH|nr:hypothetical protein AXX17_AT2G00090 [Arabidopsis thaliana]
MLLKDSLKQEVISREKKDRRDFDKLAALATTLGLYSHAYAKVVVFSKIPLPNYRFDLDDKKPQREVNLHTDLLQRVEAYLTEYLSKSSNRIDRVPANSVSRTSSISSTDEWFSEQPLPISATKILWQRSLQLRDRQQYWQASVEGQKMLDSRTSLPAFKQRHSVLTAISQNQVCTEDNWKHA